MDITIGNVLQMVCIIGASVGVVYSVKSENKTLGTKITYMGDQIGRLDDTISKILLKQNDNSEKIAIHQYALRKEGFLD